MTWRPSHPGVPGALRRLVEASRVGLVLLLAVLFAVGVKVYLVRQQLADALVADVLAREGREVVRPSFAEPLEGTAAECFSDQLGRWRLMRPSITWDLMEDGLRLDSSEEAREAGSLVLMQMEGFAGCARRERVGRAHGLVALGGRGEGLREHLFDLLGGVAFMAAPLVVDALEHREAERALDLCLEASAILRDGVALGGDNALSLQWTGMMKLVPVCLVAAEQASPEAREKFRGSLARIQQGRVGLAEVFEVNRLRTSLVLFAGPLHSRLPLLPDDVAALSRNSLETAPLTALAQWWRWRRVDAALRELGRIATSASPGRVALMDALERDHELPSNEAHSLYGGMLQMFEDADRGFAMLEFGCRLLDGGDLSHPPAGARLVRDDGRVTVTLTLLEADDITWEPEVEVDAHDSTP